MKSDLQYFPKLDLYFILKHNSLNLNIQKGGSKKDNLKWTTAPCDYIKRDDICNWMTESLEI